MTYDQEEERITGMVAGILREADRLVREPRERTISIGAAITEAMLEVRRISNECAAEPYTLKEACIAVGTIASLATEAALLAYANQPDQAGWENRAEAATLDLLGDVQTMNLTVGRQALHMWMSSL